MDLTPWKPALRAGLVGGIFGAVISFVIVTTPSCKASPETKTAVSQVAVKVADDICTEIANAPTEPGWVKLACAVGSDVVQVLLPRVEWASIRLKTAKLDAGVDAARPGPGL